MSLSNILLSIFSTLYAIGIVVIIYHLVHFGVGHELKDKKTYEQVLVLLRRHWIILFGRLLAFLLIGLIPLGIILLLGLVEVPDLTPWPHTALIIFYLIWSYGLFYTVTMYLLDVWIVTDHRVVDSEQHGFFSHTTAELNLYRIQDISLEVSGIVPTFFNYGDLKIQTAGTEEKFFFKQIPGPDSVKDLIMDAHKKFVKLHPNDVETHEHA